MSAQAIRPRINPELAEVHANIPSLDVITLEKLAAYREAIAPMFTLGNAIRGKEDVVSTEEFDIPGPTGPMRATVFRPRNQTRSVEQTPGILHIHGGGLATGNRFLGFTMLNWVEELGAVILTAEYRLAPEHPQPAALEDTYTALEYMKNHSTELGFNPEKLIVAGGSAGGNLAAGVALLARDRSGPKLAGQVLMYPWLDDSIDSLSVEQYADIVPVKKHELAMVSDYAFGKNREHADMYSAPARAKSLVGLPPTLLDVGEADVFRSQNVTYANALWRDGVTTEFHVWPGAYHGFDVFVPDADISKRAVATRLEWLRNLLSQ
ncbi:alpha/beta hydrolase [Aspergillus stella-maris]|uniref:alpha/beta hydrolase n=1 Tax=Aspergillus stella-maris TaxID=1810926 RepID=UPI003CCCE463